MVYKRTLEVIEGTEGKPHDPYGYTEFIYKVNEIVITLKLGISERLEFQDGKAKAIYIKGDAAIKSFTDITGLTPQQFERSYNKIHYLKTACPECGSHDQYWVEGFPGEQLALCAPCYSEGEPVIVDSQFCPSQII